MRSSRRFGPHEPQTVKKRSSPSPPTTIRMMPIVSRLTPSVVAFTANARMAPAARRNKLTPIPIIDLPVSDYRGGGSSSPALICCAGCTRQGRAGKRSRVRTVRFALFGGGDPVQRVELALTRNGYFEVPAVVGEGGQIGRPPDLGQLAAPLGPCPAPTLGPAA